MSEEPVDAAARFEALSTDTSFHVESPAGAGKTSLLTARFIRLLGVVDHPHEILALTFTNKAANEMRERVAAVLRQAEKDTPSDSPWINSLLPHARKVLERHAGHIHLLQAPDGLRITTFHSFCFLLARQAPCEAGIPLEASIAGDEDQADLLTEAVRAAFQEIFSSSPDDPVRQALERRLLHFNNNWSALESELTQLLAKRDLLSDLVGEVRAFPNPDHLREVLSTRLRLFVSRRLTEIQRSFLATDLGRNWTALRNHLDGVQVAAAEEIPSAVPDATWESLAAWQAVAEFCLTRTGTVRRQFTAANGFPKGFKKTSWGELVMSLPDRAARLLSAAGDLPCPDSPPADVDALFDLILVIHKAIQVHGALCRKRGVMDYAELELAALRALGSDDVPTDLQFILDHALRHILVDEFQDTSRNQWLLLQRLCAGWTEGDGRTIFVVGDPKQSIYGFRKAEVSIFSEARGGVPIPGRGRLDLVPLHLTTNFRSGTHLIRFINRVFGERIMAEPDLDADEVPYEEVKPAPGRTATGAIAMALFSERSDAPPETARVHEALWMAREIRQAAARHPDSSIGILLPARTRLTTYLEALAREGLQVQVQEGLLLKERPEVMDLLSLTRALVRPHDDLSWAALIRSSWCWVGLDTLYQVSRQGAPDWMSRIERYQHEASASAEVKNLWRAVNDHRGDVGRESLAAVAAAIWEEAGGPYAVCARFGPAGVENCRRFLHILTDVETGIPEETLARLELYMETAYAPPDPLTTRSPVQIMTIHRAKGLEFDTVFLPHLDWNPLGGSTREQPPYLLERVPGLGGDRLIALRPDQRRKEADKTYNLLKGIKRKRDLGEAKRLFYVAATRARHDLFLSGVVKDDPDLVAATSHSFLGQILAGRELLGEIEFARDPELAPLPVAAVCVPVGRERPAALSFVSERIPFEVVSPSGLGGEAALGDKGGGPSLTEAETVQALARGTVIHRLLECLSQGDALPTETAVRVALMAEGMDESGAGEAAPGVLAEVEASRREKFCSFVLGSGHPFAASEWVIEDCPEVGTVRSGVIDRVVYDGEYWWIVDYKSTPLPPEMDIEDFLAKEALHYREQLLAYRDMLVQAKGVDPDKVRLVLYFTALQRAHEMARE